MPTAKPKRITSFTDRETLFTDFKTALSPITCTKPQNKALFALATEISEHVKALTAKIPSNDLPPDLQRTLDALGSKSTDDELRAGARAIFTHRIKSDNIRGADLGKFVELLNLGAEDDKVSFLSVEFAELIGMAHPLPGLSVEGRGELQELIKGKMKGSDWSEVIENMGDELAESGSVEDPDGQQSTSNGGEQ